MATVVNRETLEVRLSVNTPDYDPADWLINPAIPDAPVRHWEIVGDSLGLKDAAGIAEADAEYLIQQRQAHKDYLVEEFNAVLDARYAPSSQRFMIKMMSDAEAGGLDSRHEYLESLWVWIQAGVAILLATHQAVDEAEEFLAVTLNLTDWLAADPEVSIRTAGEIDG